MQNKRFCSWICGLVIVRLAKELLQRGWAGLRENLIGSQGDAGIEGLADNNWHGDFLKNMFSLGRPVLPCMDHSWGIKSVVIFNIQISEK